MKKLTTKQEIRAAIALGILLALASTLLSGCGDDAYYRHKAQVAEWNAKVTRACLPGSGETLVNVRHLGEDSYIFRRYAAFGTGRKLMEPVVIAKEGQQ